MGKEQELRALIEGYATFDVDDIARVFADDDVHQATCADIRRMAELLARRSSSDEQAEVVADPSAAFSEWINAGPKLAKAAGVYVGITVYDKDPTPPIQGDAK